MMQSRFLLCAVPPEVWDENTSLPEPRSLLNGLLQDALGIERRLPKRVNLENERSRYTLCCDQIESIASQLAISFKTLEEFETGLRDGRFPARAIDEAYMHFLLQVRACLQSSGCACKLVT